MAEGSPIPELERVVLTADLPRYSLKAGDVGTIVHAATTPGGGYLVEFCTLTGDTIAVAAVDAGQIRHGEPNEIEHARGIDQRASRPSGPTGTGVRIHVPTDRIAEFCRKWRIKEFSLFGSVLTDVFRPDSDVDVLVVFEHGSVWDLDQYEAMESELQSMFGREVDLVQRKNLVNPYRRHHILTHRQILYPA